MQDSNEMAFINPKPPPFVMETRKFLAGLNLSAAQQKALAFLEIGFMKKISQLEIEFFDEVVKVLDHMESKG